MPKLSWQQSSGNIQPRKSGYDAVMLFYLIIGASGLFIFVILEWSWLKDWAARWLGEYVLLYFVALIAQGFLMYFGWIIGPVLITLYRHSWRVLVPAGLLFVTSIVFVFDDFSWSLEDFSYRPLLETIGTILMVLFFAAAFLVGLERFVRKKRKPAVDWG